MNLLSAWLLHDDHDHDHADMHEHEHRHGHAHHHEHEDHNLRAAYVHVIADAAVSVLVLIGLSAGRVLGWLWLDPVMGIVGMCVIANWSWNLIRASEAVLLDMRTSDGRLAGEIARDWKVDAMIACPTCMSGALTPDTMRQSSPWFPTNRRLP